MTGPRVFVSSTFYDLKQVRADLESFIEEMGYEPILHEKGSIPYGKHKPPEAYAYQEVELCDIMVSIIGGRFGTESKQERGYSISQNELRRAIAKGVPIYIFIDKNVDTEFYTYLENKKNPRVRYRFVDNTRVFEFIEDLRKLPCNNAIFTFEKCSEIIDYLKAQWAGSFRNFLQEQKKEVRGEILN